MRFWRFLLPVFITTIVLFAYVDNDLDGVDDTIDHCLNTPFDELVNEQGCPLNDKFPGKLIVQIGSDISFNQIDDPVSNLNIYANYMLNAWNFSVANTNYYVTNLSNDTAENNLYLTAGYTYIKENTRTRFSVGTKFDLTDRDTGARDNDFYTSVNFEYFISNQQNIFFYYSYTLSGDSDIIDYRNFHSVSLGYGYSVTDKWYTALSYNYANSYYPDTDDYHALSWFNSYSFSKSFYATLNYAHTFDDISYNHIITLNIGAYFD